MRRWHDDVLDHYKSNEQLLLEEKTRKYYRKKCGIWETLMDKINVVLQAVLVGAKEGKTLSPHETLLFLEKKSRSCE